MSTSHNPLSLSASSRACRRQLGQGMTEYIIVVALIAVAAIGVYGALGKTVRTQTAAIALELSGKSGNTAISKAKSAGNDAFTKADTTRHLGNFSEGNDH